MANISAPFVGRTNNYCYGFCLVLDGCLPFGGLNLLWRPVQTGGIYGLYMSGKNAEIISAAAMRGFSHKTRS